MFSVRSELYCNRCEYKFTIAKIGNAELLTKNDSEKHNLAAVTDKCAYQTKIFFGMNILRYCCGGIPFLRLKIRLKLAILLNPQL